MNFNCDVGIQNYFKLQHKEKSTVHHTHYWRTRYIVTLQLWKTITHKCKSLHAKCSKSPWKEYSHFGVKCTLQFRMLWLSRGKIRAFILKESFSSNGILHPEFDRLISVKLESTRLKLLHIINVIIFGPAKIHVGSFKFDSWLWFTRANVI